MSDDYSLFQERRILGLTERRWHRLGRWASVFVMIAVWGFAAYQFGAHRTVTAVADAWGWVQYQTIGSRVTANGSTLRHMTICIGPIRHNCVVDGDTVWVDGEKIRLQSMDAPEIDGRCSYERDLAQRATRRLSAILSSSPFSVSRSGKDRYGRTLAAIYNSNGEVGAMMVREGLARIWRGRREPWC
jgi:hypothetical protein